jgi:hypothetical protein
MTAHQRNLYWLGWLPVLLVACTPPTTPPPAESGPAYKPYGNLQEVMRSIPFPNANIIFDAQSNDPEVKMAAAKAEAEKPGGDPFAGIYGGWAGVQESGVALQETANLLLIPGRLCSNGLPAPVEREDWKNFVQRLADAGAAAAKAAQNKNMDAMVDASGPITEACQACHDVYRDQPAPKQRCTS